MNLRIDMSCPPFKCLSLLISLLNSSLEIVFNGTGHTQLPYVGGGGLQKELPLLLFTFGKQNKKCGKYKTCMSL